MFEPLHQNKVNFIPTLKSSQVRSPTLKSSQFGPTTQQPSQSSCLSWKQVIFGQHTSDKVNFYHRHNNQINSSLHWNKVKFKNQVKFCSPHKNVNFCPHAKTKSISIPHTKPSLFRPHHWSQVIFDAHSKNKSIWHALRHKNQVNFDPDSKPSHFRPPHKKQTNYDP